ncbi:ABC transporter permease subunit [Frigoribacterium sp. VKM Ac-2836]|uniref:ABC transporter permease subunit n=1 Tax=Frigoribacterium sp. VKM Ac-2836 TaxID=2739014 RepID=UPI0015638D74|nr:ABC transporter permease subunit [Frigoribacterium sp. VKM Ac-2836]NRD25173.1 ABC transporter permease subunit [Frigoribacterium sp. VKM Ac-2836]
MTATTPTRHGDRPARPTSKLTFGGVLRSEVIKLRTLRSTWWCLSIMVVIIVGFGALFAFSAGLFEAGQASSEQQQQIVAQSVSVGVVFGQLVASILGVLVITGEFGTGMIRSTFSTVPKRLPAVIAKLVVIAVTLFVVSLVALVLTLLINSAILPSNDITVDFGDGALWRSVIGAAASIAFTGMIAFSLGAIIRNGAGAIAAAVGLVFVLPIIVQIFTAFVDAAWVYTLAEIIPPNAAARLYDYVVSGQSAMALPSPDGALVLEPWSALLVLIGWVVVLFGLALALVKRRDV